MTTAFYHLKNISKGQLFISSITTDRTMNTFITSTIDYCCALLSGLLKNTVHQLLVIQNKQHVRFELC